ncbi:MAG: hypothetical protein ACO1OB_20895 [Archangium sp.]
MTEVNCPSFRWRVENGEVTDGKTTVKLVNAATAAPGVQIADGGATADWTLPDGGVVRELRYLPVGLLKRGEQSLVLAARGNVMGAVGELKGSTIEWSYDVPSLPSAWATNGDQLFVEMAAESISAPCEVRPGTRVVHVIERDGGVWLARSPATSCLK